jgi:hypothetical protein
MLFSRFAQFAAALVLLTAGFAAPVHTQNSNQIISGTWYEDRAPSGVTSAPGIVLTFAQTPTNQFLNITKSAAVDIPGDWKQPHHGLARIQDGARR